MFSFIKLYKYLVNYFNLRAFCPAPWIFTFALPPHPAPWIFILACPAGKFAAPNISDKMPEQLEASGLWEKMSYALNNLHMKNITLSSFND